MISTNTTILADSGYQGIKAIHSNSQTPIKNSKLHKLTKEEKQQNHNLSKQRISVENVIGDLKVFKILEGKYRNRRRKLKLRFNLICGIVNLHIV